jgi:hypothetical protein
MTVRRRRRIDCLRVLSTDPPRLSQYRVCGHSLRYDKRYESMSRTTRPSLAPEESNDSNDRVASIDCHGYGMSR